MLPSTVQTISKFREELVELQKRGSRGKFLSSIRRDGSYRFRDDVFEDEPPVLNPEFLRLLGDKAASAGSLSSRLVTEGELLKVQTACRDVVRIGCFSQQCLLALQRLMELDGYVPSDRQRFDRLFHAVSEGFADTAKRMLLLDNFSIMVRRNHHTGDLPSCVQKFASVLREGPVDEKYLFDEGTVASVAERQTQELQTQLLVSAQKRGSSRPPGL